MQTGQGKKNGRKEAAANKTETDGPWQLGGKKKEGVM